MKRLIVITLTIALSYGAGILAGNLRPVYAKMQEPGCVAFGKTGNWTLYTCVDQNGHVVIANDAGFIAPLGN